MTRPGRVPRRGPLIYVRELERTDLARLVQIEKACHPPEVRDGIDFFDALLGREWHEWPVPHGCPLPARRPIRLGLAVGPRLTGYLLARLCEVDGEACVHVDDVAVLAEERRHLIRLLDGFVRQHRTLNGDAPVIAHGYEPEMELWNRHRRVFERWGAGLAGPAVAGVRIGGRELYRVRWEPRAKAAPHRVQRDGDEGAATRLEAVGTVRAGGTEYEIQLARTVAQWESLAPAWDALLGHTRETTGFQTFRMLRLWWDHFGLSGTPFIVVIRRAGELAGIAPLAVFPTVIDGQAVRQLGYIGSRWEIDRPRLLFGEEPAVCARALARALLDRRDAWDVLHLYEQLPDSLALSVLAASLRDNGYLVGQLPDSICPYIRTVGSWETFVDARSKNLRRNLRRARRDLEQGGRLEYRVVDDPAALEAAFARYLALEGRSWKADTQVGLALDAVHQAFYRDLATRLGKECRVQFRFIEVVRERVGEPARRGLAAREPGVRPTPGQEEVGEPVTGQGSESRQYQPFVSEPDGREPVVKEPIAGLEGMGTARTPQSVDEPAPPEPVEGGRVEGEGKARRPLEDDLKVREAVAGTFGIQHAGVFYSLKITHDERFARASPGTLLESFEIRDCFEGEVAEYDFLGGFLSNKNRWTDDARTTVQFFAFPRRGRWIPLYLYRLVLRPRIKNVLRRRGWLKPLLSWRDRLRTPPTWRDRLGVWVGRKEST